MEVARFHGCGALFRRECLADAGGFFEPLGYYYEEFEMSMRVINAGWRIVFHPDMRIVHHRDPRGRDPRGIGRLIARNALMTAAARFPFWLILPAATVQITRFAIKCWLGQHRDPLGPFVAIGRAIHHLPATLQHRRPLKRSSLTTYKRLARRPMQWRGDMGKQAAPPIADVSFVSRPL